MRINLSLISNKKINRLINNRLLQHFAYWVCLIIFFGLFWGFYDLNFGKTFRNELLGLPVKIIVVYFILYFVIPKYLYTKKYGYLIILTISALILGGVINHFIYKILVFPIDPQMRASSGEYDLFSIMHRIVDINTVLVIPVIINLFNNWYKNEYATNILAKEKLETELNFLKGQIHPHFLFNTLNNLYSLIVKKSDSAGDVVLKLSELLRYLIYDTQEKEVALNKEIVNIRNYIALEKIRFGSVVDVSFHNFGDLSGTSIAPLLILPIIENSFKHSTKNETQKAWITIEISILENIFEMKVENSICENSNTLKNSKTSEGMGLSNLRRRLELLYPDKHFLKILFTDDTYLVSLKVDLKK